MCFVFISEQGATSASCNIKLIGFHNWDEKCSLRSANWDFKWSPLSFVFKGLMRQLKLFVDDSPLSHHTIFPLWITNGTMQVLGRQRAHIQDGWYQLYNMKATELLKLVSVVFRMLNIQHSHVKEICISVLGWGLAWSLHTSAMDEPAASTLSPWHWMMYIPHILKSNPHPNLIRTSFCQFHKWKKS